MNRPTVIGALDAIPVEAVTLTAGGLTARLMTFGARLTELWVPGRDGTLADIVLGFDTVEQYRTSTAYIGATCGRYGNRIRGGRFMLDDQPVQVDCNENGNHLHGGAAGLERKVWTIAELAESRVVFTIVSPAGEMGFPGTVRASAACDLSPEGLTVSMTAETDAPTVLNLVHHSYFNLAGQGSGDVLRQMLRLDAPFYTPVDAGLLPTGAVLPVAGTPFDFTRAKPIGRDIGTVPGGYDHNFCLGGAGQGLRACATAWDPVSGRKMTLAATEPGVQFYAGGSLPEGDPAKAGARLCRFAGFALETQKFPDSPNNAHFPSSRVDPGAPYRHQMQYRFTRCTEAGDDL